jgi:hypothetical protein
MHASAERPLTGFEEEDFPRENLPGQLSREGRWGRERIFPGRTVEEATLHCVPESTALLQTAFLTHDS